MPPSEWTSLVSCVGILALAVLVLLRRSANPLGLPLGLWALSLFGWNFASMAYRVSGAQSWHLLDIGLSPWTPPLALHTILAFVGLARRRRRLLALAYGGFALLSLWAVLGFVSAPARNALAGDAWSIGYAAGWAPLLGWCVWLLVRHLREQELGRGSRPSEQPLEQMRTRLLLAALLAGGILGLTELWHDVLHIPPLGAIGSLASAALVSTLVLRFRLLGGELPSTTALYLLAVTALGLLGYLVVLRSLAQSAAWLLLGTASVTAAVGAAAWDAARSLSRSWSRMKGLALLGRFSAQLAHDIKNPLAALHGAVQFLDKEIESKRLSEEHAEMLVLIAEQVTRLRRVVDKYQRLGRLEPERSSVDVNELVSSVLEGAALSERKPPGTQLERQLAPGLPACQADRDLCAAALENVVANAFDAISEAGRVLVRTSHAELAPALAGVVIAVQDSGQGMDARQQARAFDDFVSGKGSSGLGLGFVRMVLEAHGGEVRLSSTLGKGTLVELHLPAEARPKEPLR